MTDIYIVHVYAEGQYTCTVQNISAGTSAYHFIFFHTKLFLVHDDVHVQPC